MVNNNKHGLARPFCAYFRGYSKYIFAKIRDILNIWIYPKYLPVPGIEPMILRLESYYAITALNCLVICFNYVLFLFVLRRNILRAQEDDRSEQKKTKNFFFHDRIDTKIHDTCFMFRRYMWLIG